MKNKFNYIILSIVFFSIAISFLIYIIYNPGPIEIVSVKINPQKVNISLYWKQYNGSIYGNIGNLKTELEKKNHNLILATNGGMFDKKMQPIGLYIEDEIIINPINTKVIRATKNGTVPNFYLNPSGIFYITSEGEVGISTTSTFPLSKRIRFATQSGPMLITDGEINKIFNPNSKNYNIRNGVGILPNNELIFAISKNEINFYDFAKYFKNLGCVNALFLDGYVSKAYMPDKGISQLGGHLGVLIGITEK
jgi:uncharacterized protein YigE (DUF2233 family)